MEASQCHSQKRLLNTHSIELSFIWSSGYSGLKHTLNDSWCKPEISNFSNTLQVALDEYTVTHSEALLAHHLRHHIHE
jgi:hypothetical protein